MINGVITGKLANLERQLRQLGSLGSLTSEQLEGDWLTRQAVERGLQICVEVLVDVCHRCLSLERQTPASNSREAFEQCVALGVISSAEPYRKMVGFRNLIVRRYDAIDCGLMADIVNNHLADFERFRDEVVAYSQA